MGLANDLKNVVSRRALGQVLSEHLAREFQHDAFFLSHYTPEERALRPIYGEDTAEGDATPHECVIDPIYDIDLRDTPLLINRPEPAASSEFDPFGDYKRLSRSLLFCPVFLGERKVGSMSIQSYTPNKYSEADKERLVEVAALCGAALHRVREEEFQTQLWRAFDQSPAMILITDTEGRIDYANPRFLDTYGYRISEIQGSTPRIFKSEYTNPSHFSELWKTIKSGEQWTGDLANKTRDGAILHVHSCISPIFDADGMARFFISLQEDITEKHQMDRERRRRGEILEAVAYAAARFMEPTDWKVDVSEVLLRIGNTAEVDRVYLFENEMDEEGNPLMSVAAEWHREFLDPMAKEGIFKAPYLVPGMHRLFSAMDRRAIYTRKRSEAEGAELDYMIQLKTMSFCIIPTFVDNEWDGFMGIADAHTEREWSPLLLNALWIAANVVSAAKTRVRHRQALQQSEDTTRSLLDASPDAALLLDSDGNILAVNATAAGFLGYSQEDLLGKYALDFLPAEVAQRSESLFADALDNQDQVMTEDTFNGTTIQIHVTPVGLHPNPHARKIAVFLRNIGVNQNKA